MKTTSRSRQWAKALTLTRLNRKDSPPGRLDQHIKQLIAAPQKLHLGQIEESLQARFWNPPDVYRPPVCAFSYDLYSEYAARERNRLNMAAYVVQQVALTCLPHAKVNYER